MKNDKLFLSKESDRAQENCILSHFEILFFWSHLKLQVQSNLKESNRVLQSGSC